MSDDRKFLERVVVWPGPQGPGWINLHCHAKNPDPAKNGGKDWVVGWPFKDVGQFISRAQWLETTHQYYDVWYCTSQQNEIAENRAGKPKAKRLHKNASWLKAIWIDIDIKDTGYTSVNEAWVAFRAFQKKVGLPDPSAVVNSGGGLHIYWISHVPLSPADWRPYAEGLKQLLLAEDVKCDYGVTSDSVRLLRVPGTLNHKYSPPRKVELKHLGADYDFGCDLAFLQQVAPAAIAEETNVDIDPNFATAPNAAFAALSPQADQLGTGVVSKESKPLDPNPIFEQCGFLRQAKDTGGKDLDNPLWNLSVLCTTFMEDGNALAHEISKLHEEYSEASTQALYDRKVADRVDRNIGYPSCGTIAGAGCKSCATCPLFSKGKSPLNIRPAVTATVNSGPAVQSRSATALQLPPGYDLNGNGVICKIVEKRTRDGEIQETWHPLFHSRISDPWVQKDPDVIHFRVSYDKGNTLQTSMKREDWCGSGFEKKFAAAKVNYVSENKGFLEGFMNSWMAQMHEAAVAQTAQAFGWYNEAGIRRGFAYGGFIFKDDGTNPQAGMTDHETQRRFRPTGQLGPWHTACNYMLMQKRPELDAIIALSFAAPLMEMTGVVGAMLSAYGASGAGKSYALEVGAAVWGHPKESKETQKTSDKSLEKRLSATVNLPVYWDEIHDKKTQGHALEVLMLVNAGVGGGKLDQNRNQREKGTWCTLISINSNLCFKEFIAAKQLTHTAGLNRVLEYQVEKLENPQGQVPASTAAQALIELHRNYGNVGLEYAKILGTQHLVVQKRVTEVLIDLDTRLKPTEEDRFWIGVIAALLVGAELANKLNVGFDVASLEAFLLDVYAKNHNERVAATVSPNGAHFAEDQLTAFLQDHGMTSIWCERSQNGVGSNGYIPWRRLFPNAPLPNGVSVRFDDNKKTITMSTRKFREWCAREEISASAVEQSFVKTYGMTRGRASLAAGTGLGGGQERVLLIDATNHPELCEMMSRVDNGDLGTVTGMGNPIDTGIISEAAE
jgi:hypothetical protein